MFWYLSQSSEFSLGFASQRQRSFRRESEAPDHLSPRRKSSAECVINPVTSTQVDDFNDVSSERSPPDRRIVGVDVG